MAQSFRELKNILTSALQLVENLQGNPPKCIKCLQVKVKHGFGRKLEQRYVCLHCKKSPQLPANDS